MPSNCKSDSERWTKLDYKQPKSIIIINELSGDKITICLSLNFNYNKSEQSNWFTYFRWTPVFFIITVTNSHTTDDVLPMAYWVTILSISMTIALLTSRTLIFTIWYSYNRYSWRWCIIYGNRMLASTIGNVMFVSIWLNKKNSFKVSVYLIIILIYFKIVSYMQYWI